MLWIEAFHIIFMVTWFAGLFYLPRLFVYHADATDDISNERFKIMERKLFYAITTPSAVLTTLFGIALVYFYLPVYMQQGWMHTKLALVLLVWIYHILCGYHLKRFKANANTHSAKYFRWFNEVPIVLLIAIVILVVVKP